MHEENIRMLAIAKLPPARLGRLGEQRAAWYYRLRGWRVLERNLKLAGGELDLLVRRGRTIALVEVKSRQTTVTGEGHEAVTRSKRERLFRLGDAIAARYPDAQLRYDIVSVRWTGWRLVLDVYPDAFVPVADTRHPWRWRG